MAATVRCWTAANVTDQYRRTAVITGANTGVGFETALLLAQRRALVVLAGRSPDRLADAMTRIRAVVPGAALRALHLDLASLSSVRRAADRLRAEHARIDLLINNAGGARPRYETTEDGFESTFATNHLGPFAFTGLLVDRMLAVPGSRIVTVSSVGHRYGRIDFDDLHFARSYRFVAAYSQAKLANLMFIYELQRRLAAAGAETMAVAAHPGNARTEFGRNLGWFVRTATKPRFRVLTWWLMQSPQMGALPTLRAAVDPAARGGDYYGPSGRAQLTGHPTRVESSARSHDEPRQRRLWIESERLTGVTYPIEEPAARPT